MLCRVVGRVGRGQMGTAALVLQTQLRPLPATMP